MSETEQNLQNRMALAILQGQDDTYYNLEEELRKLKESD